MNVRAQTLLWMSLAVLAPSLRAADYFVDPLKGSMANPGTAVSPWSTLAEVFAASPAKIFQPGDHLYLRRGNHGTAAVSGTNTADVTIEPEVGHTPVVRLSLLNAHHWYIKGLTIPGGVVIDNQNNENSDYNTFENCYMPSGGFQVYGNYNTLRGNHIRGGGILFGFHSNYGLVSGNTLEDFYSDGMHNQGNYGVWENNLVMNSHKINGNHNDLFQSLASAGNVLRGNEFRAYTDPNQADLIAPGVSDVQGIGLFDGWYTDWVIENNVVLVDHPIGIWIQGAINCKIKNNTVLRCGQNSLFPYLYSPARFPNIRVAAKKTGAASTGNVVINNISERFELDPVIDNSGVSIGIATGNVVVAKSAFANTFLDWAQKDLHLKSGASAVIDAGLSANSPPATDADGNARPFGAAWDCGAYEYGYAPSAADATAPSKPEGLSAMIITGYGVDLHWMASADNRKVLGYDVFRNGVQVGRTRAGTNYLDINTNTTASYTVQAFDHSDNKSLLSDPISGTPPDPDTQAPTIPSNVVASAISTHSIRVAWRASADNWGVAGYQVYRDGGLVGTVTGTNYADAGLSASTLYSYTVKAYDAATNFSAFSDTASATTFAPDLTPPSTPSNVVAAAQSTRSILLTWFPATDNVGVTSYDVYRDGSNVTTVAGTNYLDTGLAASTLYSYTIMATDAATNHSAFSAAASATTFDPDISAPSVPSNLTATAASSGSILLQWSASSDNRGVAWYNIYRDGAVVDSVSTTNTLDTGLNASTLYRYNVSAVDEAGNESATSAVASATTLDPLPLLVGESFEYTAGSNLSGLNGGTGWGGAWVVGYNSLYPATIESGSLAYAGMGASGHSMKFWTKGNGTVYENLDRSFETLVADGGQTIWIGMVLALCNSKAAATWSFTGLTTDAAGASNATLFATTSDSVPTPLKLGSTTLFTGDTNFTPHLVLMKMAMSGDTNAETLTAYVDPNLGADPGTWTGVSKSNLYANGGLIGFNYRGGRASTATTNEEIRMDELRIGSTWMAAAGLSEAPTNNPPAADTEPPSIPQSLAATALSSSSIGLTWNASTDNVGVVGYEVYRGASKVASPATTNYTDTGLAPSTAYSYTVKARDATGNVSTASASAGATTLAAPIVSGALVEETFNSYTTSVAINGLSGGIGWTANWVANRANTVTTIAAGNIDGIGTGNRMSFGMSSTTPQNSRTFGPYTVSNDTTYWLAFALQSDGIKNSPQTLTLNGATGTLITMNAATAGAAPYYQFFGTTVVAATKNVQLFVIKIEYAAGNEMLTCYVNPDLNADAGTWLPAAAANIQTVAAITGITLRGNNNTGAYLMYLDNIRLATTWQAAVGQAAGPANPDVNGNGMPDAWETAHFGGTNCPSGGAADDYDHDGLTNLKEYWAGTDPTNEASVLRMMQLDRSGAGGLVLQWQSVSGKTYAIQSSTNLAAGFRDTAETNLTAAGGTMSRTVSVEQATAGFYRVIVKP